MGVFSGYLRLFISEIAHSFQNIKRDVLNQKGGCLI